MVMVKNRLVIYLVILLAGITILFLAGPSVPIDQNIRPITLPDDLDSYLTASEASFADIRPNTEKTIIWANPSEKNKTLISIVYLHGFSATRQETVPLADTLARELGANLFYTRLTGHGQDGQALAEATVNDWLNDAVEALAIGRRLGEKVIVIGTSTGGTLAIWLVSKRDTNDVMAIVLLSPNFGLRDARSEIMLWPWAKVLVPLISGPTRRREPFNPQDGQYWTTTYPTVALLPVMGLVKLAREIDVAQIKQPLFIAFSPEDKVVNPEITQALYPQFGSMIKQMVLVEETQDPRKHVIVGNIRSPDNNDRITKMILEFLESLLQ